MAYERKWVVKAELGINIYRSYYWWTITLYKTRRFWFKEQVASARDTATTVTKAKLDASEFVCKTTGIENYQLWR